MLNFGVREVANSKATSAPGWAYVPDTGVNASVTALQPTSRKRARNQPLPSQHETTAKQDAKILRELAALDRDAPRDAIPVPVRARDGAGRVSHGKVTPAVRKILQSQKTFANHLADFEALGSQTTSHPNQHVPLGPPPTPVSRAGPSSNTSTPHVASVGRRSHKKKDSNVVSTPTPLRQSSTPVIKSDPDTAMPDAPSSSTSILSLFQDIAPPAPHAGDLDPLLISRVPGMPTQEEIEKLWAHPPLTYNEARGPWVEEDKRKPVRTFCEVCGYWGRVRCTRCGGRVCALECLQVHKEECFGRYGA